MSYEPRGRMIEFMAAIRREPARLFTIAEVANVLHCKPFPSTVDQYLFAAVREGLVFRVNLRGEWLYAGSEISDAMLVASGRGPRDTSGVRVLASPFTDEDRERANSHPRAPGKAGFIPKGMTVPRAGSELHIPKFDGRAVQSAPSAPAPAAVQEEQQQPEPETPASPPVSASAAPVQEPDVEEEAEPEPFDARRWLDGDIDLYGLLETDDGAMRIPADKVPALLKLLGSVPT